MNWGGFDFTAVGSQLGALGNQLGEAIQKAKHEVESTIEGFEKGDDFVPPVASSLPHDDAGKGKNTHSRHGQAMVCKLFVYVVVHCTR